MTRLCNVIKPYAEEYYDKHLPEYCNLDPDLNEPIPEKQEYLKHIHDLTYKHPFFKERRSRTENRQDEKRKFAEKSIDEFLKTYARTFIFDKLTKELKERQEGKVYLLWDGNDFHIEDVDTSKINIVGIIEGSLTPKTFDVEVQNCVFNIRIKLNWGNNAGLANPRWKFTYIAK